MRITQNSLSYNFLSSLNKSLERQNKLMEQLSDGKQIHRPSDDPVKVIRSLKFNTTLTENVQFTQNLKDAQSWMENTDGAMTNLNSIMLRMKELLVSAGNGANPPDAVQTIGKEFDNLIDQMVTIGNTQLGDRYIFAGSKDKTQPFTRNADGTVSYSGDFNKISMTLQMGPAAADQDSVNLTGADVFGEDGVAFLNQLNEIKKHMDVGDAAAQSWLSEKGLTLLTNGSEAMLKAHTEMGTRMATYEMAATMMDRSYVTINGDLAANEDLDIPKAITALKSVESVYNASLSIGSRILPPSLVDFLK